MFGSATVLVLVLAGPPSPAGPSDARAVAERVAALVEDGRVGEALAVIEEAASTSADPRFLYMRAALEEQLGRCGVASALYREFWTKASEAEDRLVAEAGLRRCGETPPLETPPAPAPEPAPPSALQPPNPAPPPSVDERRRWTHDPVGLSLVAGAGAGALASGALALAALAEARDSQRADVQSEYRARRASTQRLEDAAVVTAGISAALLVAGTVRLIVVSRRSGRGKLARRAPGFSFFF